MPNITTNHDESAQPAEPVGSRRSEAFLTCAMTEWGNAVYRLALSLTRSKADAEDVYQDVFLRLYHDRTAFASREHLKAWLLRVTTNRCHDLAKSAWNRRTVSFDPERDDTAAPQDPKESALWDAVGALPDNLRAAVHLHYVEGYSTDEIARILNSQPATVRTWLFRARARVKELLTADRPNTSSARLPQERVAAPANDAGHGPPAERAPSTYPTLS